MKKTLFLYSLILIFLTSCDLIGSDDGETPGVGNYGVLTVSDRSDLVPNDWMPEGDMVFEVKQYFDDSPDVYSLGLSENPTNMTTIMVALGKDYDCVSEGSFCVVSADAGHPAIVITLVSSSMETGQYRAKGGVVYHESLNPLIVRFENVYMVPESYDQNGARGSFYLNGKLFSESN